MKFPCTSIPTPVDVSLHTAEIEDFKMTVFPAENSILVVGLDYEPLRLVLMEVIEDCPEPYLLDHHSFRSLEALQRYLHSPVRDHICMVSVQGDCPDPLEIKSWLLTQNLPVTEYNNPGWSASALKLQSERESWDLSRNYELAYTLAFLSCYKLRAGRTLFKLWNQAAELKYMTNELDRELSRLSHALGKDGVIPLTHCPF